MGPFVKGDVVVADFPFADLTSTKRRPCVILATFPTERVLLCMITTKDRVDKNAITLKEADFKTGSLKQDSCIRPNYLFTTVTKLIDYRVGVLTAPKFQETVQGLIKFLSAD